MEVALTFGSLGDIIAICQLALQLKRALGNSVTIGESAKEYQELRKDLTHFVNILMQVVATYQHREYSLHLSELDRITKSVVDECYDSIMEALQYFDARYHPSLGEESPSKGCKAAYKKVKWTLSNEKTKVQELQGKLQRNTDRLNLLTALALRKSARLDRATMDAKLERIHEEIEAISSSRQELLHILKEQSVQLKQHVSDMDIVNNKLNLQLRNILVMRAFLRESLSVLWDVKEMITSIARVTTRAYETLSAFNRLCFLDPTRELPVILEDSLGRKLLINPQLVDVMEWKTFYSLLEDWFKEKRGYDMVRRREYTIEEEITQRIFETDKPLKAYLRRGMRITMSMLYLIRGRVERVCPRCRTRFPGSTQRTQCETEGCGMYLCFDSQPLIQTPQSCEAPVTSSADPNDPSVSRLLPAAPDEATSFQRVRFSQLAPVVLTTPESSGDVKPMLGERVEESGKTSAAMASYEPAIPWFKFYSRDCLDLDPLKYFTTNPLNRFPIQLKFFLNAFGFGCIR